MNQNCILISHLLLQNKTVRASAPDCIGKSGETAWACLRQAHAKVSEMPTSSIIVPGRGLEPPWNYFRLLLRQVRLPISPPRHNIFLQSAPGRIRTFDRLLKRQLLYRLSYGRMLKRIYLYHITLKK